MKKRFLSLLCVLALCLGLLPVTSLAAGSNTVYVGGVALTGSSENIVYATTNENGEVTTEGATTDNYNIKWDGSTLTLRGATIKNELYADQDPLIYITGAAIGVFNQSGDANLTITLEGTNTIKDVSYGICVLAPSNGSAKLTITGSGSLDVSATSTGIRIQSHSGDAAVSIKNAKVTATAQWASGVNVRCGTNSSASLTVNGGNLTSSGSQGILYDTMESSIPPTIKFIVSNSALVDARGGGIGAGNIWNLSGVSPTDGSVGIVFGHDRSDSKAGTVYGDVTLQEDLEIGEGESLTIGDGASLNTGSHEVIVNGGTLTGGDKIEGTVKYAPAITTESLPGGTVGEPYTETILAATGDASITWSVSNGSLPAGLSLSKDGKITGTPTTEGTSTFTVTATNNIGSDSREFTLKIEEPAFIPVTDLELNKGTLTLQEKDSDTLTVTVKPADATNQDVTWESSDNNIATVSEDGTVTAINAGTATITATAADGSGISASCNLTVTHGNMIQTPKKDATCTVDGTEEYWTCEICGKHYKDESGTIPTTPEENKIQATGHSYGEPVWNWSEDGKTCTVTFTCEKDETHKKTPKVTVTSAEKTPGTCTEAGVTTYTATVEFNGNTYTDTKDVADIPATGHSYGEPVWSWAEDGKTCKVTFTCEKDENHKETPEVKVTSAVKTPATCTEKGVTTYTATVEFNGKTYTDTKDLTDIPATGHSYGESVWNWSEDGKTCTVTFICEKDETHKETPKVKITSAVKTPATCTEAGVTTYTATVEFNGKTYTDTKDLADIPATGHSYGEPVWNWSEDGKTCTVTFTCEKDETHKETPKVIVTSAEKTPGTCTETGVTTYTATVEFNGQTYTDTKDLTDIPATGHSYENGKCTVCGAIASDFKAVITAGANGTWQKGTKDGLSFTSNAAYKHFQKVQVDGKDLDASNYTVKEGSTIVTLKASYLETLSVGKHTLAIVSETGTATTEFTIKAAASANDRNPANPNGEATESVQTGDNTNMMLWIVMLFVSASILGIAVYEKRKKHMEN